MKLETLKTILYSNRGQVQLATLYNSKTNTDIDNGTIDYIVNKYSNVKIIRIEAYNNELILTI